MSWNWSTAAVGGSQGAQAGYNVGGPWGAAVGGVAGTLVGGLALGGSPGMPPASPLAGMSDVEYNWYRQNILPLQQKQWQSTFGPTAVSDAVTTAESDVNQQYAGAPAALQRQAASMGVVMTPAQRAAASKNLALDKGIATAGAANQARAGIALQQRRVLGA